MQYKSLTLADSKMTDLGEQANDIHNLFTLSYMLSLETMEDKLKELENLIHKTKCSLNTMLQIYSSCKRAYDKRCGFGARRFGSSVSQLLSAPEDETLPQHGRKMTSNQTNLPLQDALSWLPSRLVKKEVAPDIVIQVREVDTLEDVPQLPIYWVRSMNTFAIKLCRRPLTGSICKIITKKTPNKYEELKRSNTLLNSSWLYTQEPVTSKNAMMRHFGTRETLSDDMKLYQKNNTMSCMSLSLRERQLMHDLLVLISYYEIS